MLDTNVNTAVPLGPLYVGPVRNESSSAEPSSIEIQRCRIWDIDFAVVNMDETLRWMDHQISIAQPSFVITANLNFVMLRERDRQLQQATCLADLVLCDGMPILWRSKLESHPLPERVAGSDLIFRICEQAARKGHSVYFLGGAEGVAQSAAEKLQQLYPGLHVAGVHSPPFRTWTKDDLEEINQRIRSARPDILLVAFGQPKGELWIAENFKQLGVPINIQLGASFDFVAGTAKRAPRFLQIIGLEWLYRACTDPKRLFPRYAKNLWFLLRTLRREIINSGE